MISVWRHLTKNPPGLPQKSSETPSTSLLVKRGRGPKDPASQTLNGVVAPFQAPTKLLRQLLVQKQDRRCHGSSPRRQAAILSRSRVFDPGTRRHAFGLWVSLRHPIFKTGSMPCWLAVYFHATHFIASPRSPVIGRLPETVKHLTGSPWPSGMGLRSGLTDYFKEEFEAFVFLDGFFEAVSSVYTRVLAGLSVLPVTTDASNFQSAPDPMEVEGRWQWSPLVAILATAQLVLSG